MPPVEFEPTISAGERSQTYVLNRADTGIGAVLCTLSNFSNDELEALGNDVGSSSGPFIPIAEF
jgi:hypothetical protein